MLFLENFEMEKCLLFTAILELNRAARVLYKKLDPVSRVTGILGWYWILGIKCSDITGVGLVY